MADCESVDAALARLGGKLDGLNKKLNDLEKNCCNKNGKNGSPFDPSEILRRLDELEAAVRKLVRYANQIDDAVKAGNQALKAVTNLFNF